ncbi:expressed unknown protein [Ectocarpus siliculosus]|uniref:Uncharacterized protein n=1 Tax=Ectocarpus siliculosus TaxID=2880 RepID=D8LGH2_ECTSI|nr:expressed unknown protein [Ectocarpus siliculosus]|eukprot:CBN75747.1 expressed unknown protein [Ectocarpus siliculosus]
MPRSRWPNTTPSGAGPACLVLGLLLSRSGRSVQAFVPAHHRGVSSLTPPSAPARGGRALVRPRAGDMRLSATGGSGGAGDIDSSELYADMRRRLEELRQSSSSSSDTGLSPIEDDVSDLGLFQQQNDEDGGGGGGGGAKAYSAQEMKQRYYEAFWRARNLHKEAKFEGSSGIEDDYSSDTPAPPATPPPEAEAGSRTTILSHMAMDMFLSRGAAAEADDADATATSSSDVQGLTQMYYLELEEEERALASTAAAAATTAAEPLPVRQPQHAAVGAEAVFAASDVAAAAESMIPTAEPQGLTQVFFLDPKDEALAAAALPVVPGRSFLRERLGVPGEVVQDLRQVELDHARLAMLAVLLSGAVGAGAGAGAGVLLKAHDGFSALADVARTPWLDPYVAGGILAAKALSEGDWRIGKGAMAGWADRALSAVSNTGAKVLRLGSGNECLGVVCEAVSWCGVYSLVAEL